MHIQPSAVGVEDFHSNAPVLFFLLIKGCSGLDGQKRRFTSRVLLANILSPAQQGVVPAPIRISLVVWFIKTSIFGNPWLQPRGGENGCPQAG